MNKTLLIIAALSTSCAGYIKSENIQRCIVQCEMKEGLDGIFVGGKINTRCYCTNKEKITLDNDE